MNIVFVLLGVILVLLSIPAIIEIAVFIAANLVGKSKNKVKINSKSIKIGVVVPAHNEEKSIERCINSILNSDRGVHSVEVVVIADNCNDTTAEKAKNAGARVVERFNKEKIGKGAALDYTFNILKNDNFYAYIIIDADTIVGKEFITVMGDNFANGEDVLQSGYLVLNKNASSKTRFMNLALLSMNYFRPMGREIIGSSVGILGNGFGLSKKLVDEVPYSANSITEDLEYHIKLIEAGKRVKFVNETIVLADFPLSDEGNETQRARWEGGRFLLQRKYGPKLILKIFKGKIKIIEPFLELMSMPLSYEVIMLIGLLFIPFWEFRLYGILGVLIIAAHIFAAVIMYGDKEDFKALKEVPKYVLWKIIKFPMIIANAKKNVKWVRTKRD